MHSDAAVEVGVRRLLERQLDIAANGPATDLFGAAVRRFHDAGSAAGHDSETQPRNRFAHLSREFVMWIVDLDAGRAKHGDAWSNKVQDAKTAKKIAHHSQESNEFVEARPRSFEEDFIRAFGRRGQR